jgi:hypothetical protein
MWRIRSATVMIRDRGHTFKGLTKAMYQYTFHLQGQDLPLPPNHQLSLSYRGVSAGHTLSSTHIVYLLISVDQYGIKGRYVGY